MTRLIWLCVLPLVLMAIYMAVNHIRDLQTLRDRDATDRMRNVANAFNRNLAARIAALQVLSSSPHLDEPLELGEIYEEAQRFRGNFGGHVILADLSKQMLINTRAPLSAALPKLPQPKGHSAVAAVLATGKPAVGDIFFGPIAKEPLVAIAVPVTRNDRTKALLLHIIETRQFQQRLEEVALPEGWFLAVLDGNDEVIAARGPSVDGESRPSAGDIPGHMVSSLAVAPWSVVLEIPRDLYRASTVEATTALVAAIFAVTLVSVLGGGWASRRLGQAVATLTHASPNDSAVPITEITAARRLLDASAADLRESEERFRRLFQDAPVAMGQVGNDGVILAQNARFEQLFGYARGDLPTIADWFRLAYPDPAYRAQVQDRWNDATEQAAAQGSNVVAGEYRVTCKDGTERIVQITGIVTVEGLLTAFADVTERRRAEEAIRRLNEELEERVRERTAQLEAVNRELEDFSYSVSHDLKAPLRGIEGYSRLLEEEYHDRLDEEGKLFIRNVRVSAEQMHQLIEDLLAYSRMERRSLQCINLDLPALVQAVVAERAAEIEQAGVQLHLEVPNLAVRADRDGLAVVLRNLLENACKFSRTALPPTIDIGAREAGDKAILWMRDNGIGFDMKYHDRIFEIFQRLQRSEDYPGTGIGLALVRKAMGRMGGRVWAKSTPGEGATFYLEIPR
jgi:PAS domain S-box-containing protein